jgi:PAS domain S-box-containing protein
MNQDKQIRVLCVEDDPICARLLQRRLVEAGYSVDIAPNGQAGLVRWEVGAYDILLVDHDLPIQTGLEMLRNLVAKGPLPPTMMITGPGNEMVAVEAMNVGVDDYLIKDALGRHFELVPQRIQRILRTRRALSEKLRAEEMLGWATRLSSTLTDLFASVVSPTSSIRDISVAVLEKAKLFTDSPIGFAGEAAPDPDELIVHTFDQMILDRSCNAPVRAQAGLPDERGANGRRLLHRSISAYEPFFTNSPWTPADSERMPIGHIEINRFLAAPVVIAGKQVGGIVLANAARDYTDLDLEGIRRLARYYALGIQRKLTEDALQKSEAKYRTLVEAINDGLAVIDENQRITYVNNKLCRMLGYAREELVGLRIEDIIYHDAHKTGDGFPMRPEAGARAFESALRTKNGQEFAVIQSETILDEEQDRGQISCVVFTDIRFRKRAEETIQRQYEFLDTVIESLSHPFYVIDAHDYTIMMANSAAQRSLSSDIPSARGVDMKCYQMTHQRLAPCDGNDHVCPLTEVKRTQKPVTVEHTHYDRSGNARTVEIRAYPVFDRDGNLTQIIEDQLDITERKDALEALRESEDRYRRIVETANEGIWSVDADGMTTFVNDRMAEILGTTVASLTNTSMFDHVQEDWRPFAREIILGGREAARERHDIKLRSEGSAELWVNVGVTPFFDSQGKGAGALAMMTDISRRRNAEKLAVQAGRLKAVAELSAGVSHNFNNLLQMVMGGLHLSLMNLELGNYSEVKTDLEEVLRGCKFGARTVKRLQDFAKSSSGVNSMESGQPLDLSSTVEQALLMSKPLWKAAPERIGVPISVSHQLTRGCMVKGKENELFEVVVNLVKNAVEAMPDGGDISVRTFVDHDKAVLQVRDNGMGIPKDDLGRIFEPFWTSKGVKGTGMGLPSSHGIVALHGGELLVDSEPGKGTTFTVRLPLAGETPEDAAVGMADFPWRLSMLVVDDQQPIVRVLASALRMFGQTVIPATSGEDGFRIFQETPSDVVICDLGMPGMNGWQVGAAVKVFCLENRIPKPIFIIATGWGDQTGQDDRILESGVDAIVEKPLDVKKMMEIIRDLMAGRAGPSRSRPE